MTSDRFDAWLETNGPVAVVVQEELEPVEGKGSVFFPPTFAPPQGSADAPGFLIDQTATGKVALVDTVGSQANRMEPLFKQAPYSGLVPRATVKIGERDIDLLDAGHRAADAVVRFSDKWSELRDAFTAIKDKHDATKLAKMAPTSLVFGVWDSRDTQVKLPRLVGSTIRAYDVDKLTRKAQFFASTEKEDIAGIGTQTFLSSVGLDDAPADRADGGVISRGGIRRQAVLNLVALRALTGSNAEETRRLQRYILGIALVALFAQPERFLRQGCLLTPAEDSAPDVKLVERTGKRTGFQFDEARALEFANAAKDDFGVGSPWVATFSAESAKQAAKKK